MPTRVDARGLTVTAESAAEVASIDAFTARLLRIERGLEAILEDAKTFPNSPLVQMLAAAFCLFGQTGPSDVAAATFLAAAGPLAASGTEREQRLYRALSAWAKKDHLGAVEVLEGVTRQWPSDLLAAKLAEFFYYVLGQQHEAGRFLSHMQRLAETNRDDPDLLAMLAFAHELSGDIAGATRHAERALALTPNNPWAHHCLAHVYLHNGDPHCGAEKLESFLPLWMTAGRFIHCHNTWHLALAYLETLDRDRALDLYRRHVWGITPQLVTEQLDAIALLWRMEMAGADVDDLWSGVADAAETQVDHRYMPFMDAHYAFALARGGRTAATQQLLGRVAERAAGKDAEAARSWAPVGKALIEAAAALATGDAARAAALLDPVMTDITIVGGSDAQDDLFRQAYFHALVGAGRHSDARAWWKSAKGGRPLSPLDHYRLGLAV